MEKQQQDLRLPLMGKWFKMTEAGTKKEDYRELSDFWIKRLVESITLFSGRYDSLKDISVKEAGINNVNLLHLSLDVLQRDVKLKKFDINVMTLGYPKSTDTDKILTLEHKGIRIGTGKPEWGAEPEKIYFVIMHGEIIKNK